MGKFLKKQTLGSWNFAEIFQGLTLEYRDTGNILPLGQSGKIKCKMTKKLTKNGQIFSIVCQYEEFYKSRKLNLVYFICRI